MFPQFSCIRGTTKIYKSDKDNTMELIYGIRGTKVVSPKFITLKKVYVCKPALYATKPINIQPLFI